MDSSALQELIAQIRDTKTALDRIQSGRLLLRSPPRRRTLWTIDPQAPCAQPAPDPWNALLNIRGPGSNQLHPGDIVSMLPEVAGNWQHIAVYEGDGRAYGPYLQQVACCPLPPAPINAPVPPVEAPEAPEDAPPLAFAPPPESGSVLPPVWLPAPSPYWVSRPRLRRADACGQGRSAGEVSAVHGLMPAMGRPPGRRGHGQCEQRRSGEPRYTAGLGVVRPGV
jgi:hypothetical protein